MSIFQTLAKNKEFNDFSTVQSNGEKKENNKFDISNPQENENIFQSLSQKKSEKNFSFLDTLKDVGQQILSKGASGLAGAYGDVTGVLGLGTKETLPGEEIRRRAGFEDPTSQLAQDEDLIPNYTNLPTSSDVKQGIESLTGIGEGETPAGRIAGRGAEFIGGALSMPGSGLKSLATAAGSGIAGQSLREIGAPEALATGTEIASSIIPSAISGKLEAGKKTKNLVDAGRRIGLSENQITPLIQSEKKIATIGKIAHKGERTKELFTSIKDTLGNSYDNVKNSVANLGKVNASNSQLLQNKFTAIRDDLLKTVKASPDKEAAIKFIDEAIDKISKTGASPEELVNFWQDINKSVRWNSLQGGKKSLTRLKEPISEVLNNVAPQAAKDFEMTNELYSKYAQISKKLKPDLVDSFANKGEMLAAAPAALALVWGNLAPLAGLASEFALRRLAREMIVNPLFQNIGRKLVKNLNGSSVNGIKQSLNKLKELWKKKVPEQNWDFLISGDTEEN